MGISALAGPVDALGLSLRIGAIGVAISSGELLSRPRELAAGGLLSGNVTITRSPSLIRGPLRPLMAFVAPPAGARSVVVVRLAAALAIIVGAGNFEVARFGAIVVALTTLLLRMRSPFGIHASGTMVAVVFTAGALGFLVGTPRAMGFALAFIAAEGCLAYFIAGTSKLQTPSWRNGQAIPAIVSTVMWGNRDVALALRSRPRLGLAMCWLTMLGESSIPLALVLPLPISLALLAMAMCFHLVVAVEMGLNSFIWAFGSTYPAIIYSWYWLHH